MKSWGTTPEFYIWAGMFAPQAPTPVLKVLTEATARPMDAPGFKSAMEKMKTPSCTWLRTNFRSIGIKKPKGSWPSFATSEKFNSPKPASHGDEPRGESGPCLRMKIAKG